MTSGSGPKWPHGPPTERVSSGYFCISLSLSLSVSVSIFHTFSLTRILSLPTSESSLPLFFSPALSLPSSLTLFFPYCRCGHAEMPFAVTVKILSPFAACCFSAANNFSPVRLLAKFNVDFRTALRQGVNHNCYLHHKLQYPYSITTTSLNYKNDALWKTVTSNKKSALLSISFIIRRRNRT